MTISRRSYRSDLSDARWALIEPILTKWRAARTARGLGINSPVHDLREIVNAIFYIDRTCIEWDYLPHDFPVGARCSTAATRLARIRGSSRRADRV